jgi:hypothetical protein
MIPDIEAINGQSRNLSCCRGILARKLTEPNVFDSDVVPTPLTFDTIDQALAYVARTPGTLRVVEVTDAGERVPVEAGVS